MPLNKDIKKVLVIGSGPIVIGQAAEFDYAGTQACRALRDDGIEIVLVNSNPATIMTDKAMADKIYIEPLTLTTVKRIIEKEKPDSILSGFGGQTGLTLSMQLAKEGFLAKHNVRLLGASPETIDKAEDRQIFKDTMEKIGQPCIPSKVVTTVEDAEAFALEIGYPVIIRPWAVLAAALSTTRRNCGRLLPTVWHFPPLLRSWWKSPSPAGKRSSSRSCVTARATPSPCAPWRTWTRWACIPATPSLSPPRSPFLIKSIRCSAPLL